MLLWIIGFLVFLFVLAVLAMSSSVAKYKARMSKVRERFAVILNGISRIEITVNKDAPKLNRALGLASEFKIRNITKSTPFNKVCDFVAIDIETTGIKLGGNRIIEFSAIRFSGFEPVDCITTLIDPSMEIPADATAVNNITNDMIAGKPKFYEVADSIREYIGNYAIIGHNVTFDLKHLAASGLDLSEHKIIYCTLEMSRKFNKNADKHALDSVCETFGIYRDDAHRALSDCLATAVIYAAMLSDIMPDQEAIKGLINNIRGDSTK